MRITLENEENITITVIRSTKNNDLLEYYVGDEKIGVLETDVMSDNILILQNTLENELLTQIKDYINRLPREEIEREGDLTRNLDTYLKEFGKRDEKIESLTEIKLENEEDKSEEKNNSEKETRGLY